MILVGEREEPQHSRDNSSKTAGKKIADICMISQQQETTTVTVEVHRSQADEVLVDKACQVRTWSLHSCYSWISLYPRQKIFCSRVLWTKIHYLTITFELKVISKFCIDVRTYFTSQRKKNNAEKWRSFFCTTWFVGEKGCYNSSVTHYHNKLFFLRCEVGILTHAFRSMQDSDISFSEKVI